MAENTPNRIKAFYDKEVVTALMKQFKYKNVNMVPKLVKITINSGLGDVKDNSKSVHLISIGVQPFDACRSCRVRFIWDGVSPTPDMV